MRLRLLRLGLLAVIFEVESWSLGVFLNGAEFKAEICGSWLSFCFLYFSVWLLGKEGKVIFGFRCFFFFFFYLIFWRKDGGKKMRGEEIKQCLSHPLLCPRTGRFPSVTLSSRFLGNQTGG